MSGAARDELVILWGGPQRTLDEKWNTGSREGHWYAASTEFAKQSLGNGDGRSCLVIGSPLFEADELGAMGWKVTYLDIRVPPVLRWAFVQCDATKITLPDASFDAVSTSCVLTHAGTGRYGDGTNREHGDEVMLSEIARVMKMGAVAALTFGACADMPRMVRLGHTHRIYTVPECSRMLAAAGLKMLKIRIWGSKKKAWLAEGDTLTTDMESPDYISFKVVK